MNWFIPTEKFSSTDRQEEQLQSSYAQAFYKLVPATCVGACGLIPDFRIDCTTVHWTVHLSAPGTSSRVRLPPFPQYVWLDQSSARFALADQ